MTLMMLTAYQIDFLAQFSRALNHLRIYFNEISHGSNENVVFRGDRRARKPRQGAFVVGGKPPITPGIVGQRGKVRNLRKGDQLVPCY